jgi:hypothetical protein
MSTHTQLRPDKWSDTDLPVLLFVAEAFDSTTGGMLANDQVIVQGLTQEEVTQSLVRLVERGKYINGSVTRTFGGIAFVTMQGLTERGLRAVGDWPSDDRAVEAIVAALKAAADREPDPSNRSKLGSAAAAVGQVLGTAAGETLGAFIRQQLGIPS